MIVIGLTGSIGMGKSTIAGMFRELGVHVHDADEAVHRLMEPGQKGYEQILEAFPRRKYPKIYRSSGIFKKTYSFDRKAFGRLIFSDPALKARLEGILHPLVREDQHKFIAKMRKFCQKEVLLDIPLLFETGADARVDTTVCVSAPAHIQKARVLSREGMSGERFEQILKAQMPDRLKRVKADYVINTGAGYGRSFAEVKKTLSEIRKTYNKNDLSKHVIEQKESRRF